MALKPIDELIEELKKKEDAVKDASGARSEAQHRKGKLTARERITSLLDTDSFVETDLFAEHRAVKFGMQSLSVPADGVVTGYGTIDGRQVCVYSQDFSAMGGSLGEMHAQKINKVQDLAIKTGAPLIGIQDSGGARIQEGVDSLHGYGQIFLRNVRASGVIPQISVILGPCAGGAVYSPGLTDFVLMVDRLSFMFITGPEVIKAVLSTEISPEDLGGAKIHNTKSGNAHFIYPDEEACILGLRQLLSFLPQNCMDDAPVLAGSDDPNRVSLDLRNTVPTDSKLAYDVRAVIRTVADDGKFLETQALFAKNIVTGFVRLGGESCGIIANQPAELAGCLDVNSSDKAARFVRFCDCFNLPIISFVDTPGYLPGPDQEHDGIIRHGAKLLYAYSEASVPKVTVTLRKSYGGASIAMCNKDLGADFTLAWPQAEIAVMGATGAVNIIFRKEIKGAADPVKKTEELKKNYEEVTITPYEAAKRGYIDMVIYPEETRPRLISALRALKGKKETPIPKKHGNIPL